MGRSFNLSQALDHNHFLYVFEKAIPWQEVLLVLPPRLRKHKDRRLLVSLYILGQQSSVPGERLLGVFLQNVYWQYFAGKRSFVKLSPLTPEEVISAVKIIDKHPSAATQLKRILDFARANIRSGTLSPPTVYREMLHRVATTQERSGRTLPYRPVAIKKTWITACGGVAALIQYFTTQGWRCFSVPQHASLNEALSGRFGYFDIFFVKRGKNQFAACFLSQSVPNHFETLDRIVRMGGTLSRLIENKTLWQQYYTGLTDYYSPGRFPKSSFNAITRQLRIALREIPEIDRRLLGSDRLGTPFSITLDLKSYGRDLDRPAFERFLSNIIFQLQKEIQQFPLPFDLAPLISTLEQEARNFDHGLLGLGRQKRAHLASIQYAKMRSVPAHRSLAAYILLEHLNAADSKDILESSSADLILSFFENIRQNPGALFSYLGLEEKSGVIFALIKERIPSLSEMLKNETIFTPRSEITTRGSKNFLGSLRNARYDFVPIQRRIHGIWKGVPWMDCVGGSPKQLDQLTPERWLTIAIQESQLYHIQRNGRYLGNIHLVPIKIGRETFASIEIATHLLSQNGVFVNPATHRKDVRPILELWLNRTLAFKPKNWEGIVVGQSNGFNYVGALEAVRASRAFIQGTVVGQSRDVAHADPIAAKIIRLSEKYGFNKNHVRKYAGNMVLDATVGDAGALVKLAEL